MGSSAYTLFNSGSCILRARQMSPDRHCAWSKSRVELWQKEERYERCFLYSHAYGPCASAQAYGSMGSPSV